MPTGSRPTTPPRASVFAAALRLLGRREYTTAEIRSRLVARGYPVADVEQAVRRLQDEGALDDRRAGAVHVRQAEAKGRGRYRIARELSRRGVDESLVTDLLAARSDEQEVRLIEQVLARRRTPSHLAPKARHALIRHLLGRGFAMDTIRAALGRHETD